MIFNNLLTLILLVYRNDEAISFTTYGLCCFLNFCCAYTDGKVLVAKPFRFSFLVRLLRDLVLSLGFSSGPPPQ